jgi:hypothetical protein
MNKKQFFLSIFILSLSFFVYAIDIPKELQDLGFAENTLVSYSERGNKEYFTFSDWTTGQPGDTVTFVVHDGKVKERYHSSENGEVKKEEKPRGPAPNSQIGTCP